MSVTSLSDDLGDQFASISFSSFEEIEILERRKRLFPRHALVHRIGEAHIDGNVNRFNRAVSDEPETEAVVEV